MDSTFNIERKTHSAKRTAHSAKGITLIEMVAVIVVLGLAIPALLTMWADVAWRSARSEAIADATFYAQELMEEIKSKKFEDPDQTPVFGPESGESGHSNYDDVDDFNGYSDSPATGYNRCVTVDYVTLSGSNWTGNCGGEPTNCTAPTCEPSEITDYKRIIVRVNRTDNLVSNVTLVTIVSGY